MRLRSILPLFVVVFSAELAHAKVGPRDLSGYVGTDTLAPQLTLPTTGPNSFLATPDTTGTTFTILASAATLVSNGDDFVYGFAMPANVRAYGAQMTSCRAHTNGLVTCTGSSTPLFDNRRLPDSRWNGAYVFAPFWDDLLPVANESTITTEAKAGEYFAVQWNNFALYKDPAARLSFRVTFQDNASVRGYVLFQYLAMNGMGADGSGATIGIANSNGYSANVYSHNTTGAIVTGGAGPDPSPTPSPAPRAVQQAILFDWDGDGDRVSTRLETLFTTSDSDADSDDGGQDDGAELANGKDPKSGGDDATLSTADGDSDGLTDAEEAFYGTNPAAADTDGDGLADNVEVSTMRNGTGFTDPTKKDTDRDGFDDKVEVDDATNPLDPDSHGSYSFVNLETASTSKHRPDAALDAMGNIHVAVGKTDDTLPHGVYYYMINPDGTKRIPETFLKAADDVEVNASAYWTSVSVFEGKVYIVYELRHWDTNESWLGFIRLNPAAVSQNGSAVSPQALVEVHRAFAVPGVKEVGYPDMAVAGSGVHVVFRRDNEFAQSGQPGRRGFGYLRLGLDGTLQSTLSMLQTPFNGTGGGSGNGRGLDYKAHAQIAVDGSGVAHLAIHGRSGQNKPSQSYYAMVKDGVLSGPYYYGTGIEADVDVVAKNNLVYLFGTGGGNDGSAHGGFPFGLLLAILDPANMTVIPRVGDNFGVTQAIDPTSMVLPQTVVYVHDDATRGANLKVLDSGALLFRFETRRRNDICMGVFAPTGAKLGEPICAFNGQSYFSFSRQTPLLPLANGRVGVVFSPNKDSSEVRYGTLPMTTLFDTTNVPPPPTLNKAPVISTGPSLTASVGVAYSYMAGATDPETGTLTWSLISGPPGLTVSAMGAVSWTPTVTDLGPHEVTIQVCDNGALPRCTGQRFTITVTPGQPPVITSVPGTTAVVGRQYVYQVTATDPDNAIASYALAAPMPALGNMAMSATGLLTWTPTAADLGSVSVQVRVTDATMLSASQSFTITVLSEGSNQPPYFTSIPSTTAVAGAAYKYQATAVDPDDSAATFTYALTSTASGDLAVASNGALTWTPAETERGVVTITITATGSNSETATQSFSVTVLSKNVESGPDGCGCVVGGAPDRSPPTAGLLLLAMGAWMLTRLRRHRR